MRWLCAVMLCLFGFLGSSYGRSDFEKFGDVFRFLPLYVMVASAAIEDYEGVGELTLGALSTQLATEAIKKTFETLHEQKGYSLDFAKRPCCNDWKGMPSGHTSGAFSAAGYVYYRYGWKPAIPVTILAALTGASRIEAKKHSVLQVSVGALLAWGFAWAFTKEYMPKNTLITPNIETDSKGNPQVSLNVRYAF